jgi:hypothetical protein
MNVVTEAISVVLLAAHLLAVNLTAGGPLVAAILDWFPGEDSHTSRNVLRQLLVVSLQAGLLGLLLGLALIGFDYWQGNMEKFAPVTHARWWIVGGEFAVGMICSGVAILTWRLQRRWIPRLFALAAATNLLYHFPLFFSALAVIPQRADWAGMELEAPLRAQLLRDSEVWARALHVILASIAVSGWAAVLVARRGTSPPSETIIRRGTLVCLAATIAQFAGGLWLLLEVPTLTRNKLLGDNVLAAIIFAAAILLALRLMHLLAVITLGDSSPRNVRGASGALLAVILLMAGVLRAIS